LLKTYEKAIAKDDDEQIKTLMPEPNKPPCTSTVLTFIGGGEAPGDSPNAMKVALQAPGSDDVIDADFTENQVLQLTIANTSSKHLPGWDGYLFD